MERLSDDVVHILRLLKNKVFCLFCKMKDTVVLKKNSNRVDMFSNQILILVHELGYLTFFRNDEV